MIRQLGICIVAFGMFTGTAVASEGDLNEKGSVIVESPIDLTADYKKRRTKHGFLLSVSQENFYPLDYQSQFGDVYVENIINSDSISLVGLELGYKYNISIGSVAGLFSYASGSHGGATAGREMTVSKQSLAVNAAIDGVFEEPWVVPYAQVGMTTFTVSETNATDSKSASTSFALNYKYGLLFQIDWLEALMDPSAKADRLRSSGLENTFIDVYYATYSSSSAAQDPGVLGAEGEPNMGSADEMGIGLKLEF